MKCPACGCVDIEFNESAGYAACVQCGTVLEENTIVSSVEFQESGDRSHVVGQFVSANCSKSFGSSGRGGRYGFSRESREATLANARRAIIQVASGLRLPNYYSDRAHRLYSLALQRSFLFGRRQMHIVAVCLYIICRQEKSPHLLIDFSDALRVNVYIIGKHFLQFIKLLNLKLPIVDPSLYIHRYAGRLDFGDKLNTVTTTAMRTVTRFNKDWITTGRRPDGICAAALFIAARSHGFERTHKEVCEIFRISTETLKKRLGEFRATPSSQLTLDQFTRLDMAEEFDPPCFIQSQLNIVGHTISLNLPGAEEDGDDIEHDLFNFHERTEDDISDECDSDDDDDGNRVALADRGVDGSEMEDRPSKRLRRTRTTVVDIQGVKVRVPLPVPQSQQRSRRRWTRLALARQGFYREMFVEAKAHTAPPNAIDADEIDGEEELDCQQPQETGEASRRRGIVQGSVEALAREERAVLSTKRVLRKGKVTLVENKTTLEVIPNAVANQSAVKVTVIANDNLTPAAAAAAVTSEIGDKSVSASGAAVTTTERDAEGGYAVLLSAEDMQGFFLTAEESAKRSAIWERMHRSFMDDRARRHQEREQDIAARQSGADAGMKGRGRGRKSSGKQEGTSAAAALGLSVKDGAPDLTAIGRASKKINYQALQGVFDANGNFVPPSAVWSSAPDLNTGSGLGSTSTRSRRVVIGGDSRAHKPVAIKKAAENSLTASSGVPFVTDLSAGAPIGTSTSTGQAKTNRSVPMTATEADAATATGGATKTRVGSTTATASALTNTVVDIEEDEEDEEALVYGDDGFDTYADDDDYGADDYY